MKKFTLICAISMMAFAGCTCGQGWRPNFLNRLHDRFHGPSNVGEPCDVGCAPAPPMPGCATCGNGVGANYGGYESEMVMGPSEYSISNPPATYAQPGPESIRSAPMPRQ